MADVDRIQKAMILKWLKGKTQDQIADKFVEALEVVHDMTVNHYNLKMRNDLFKALCKPYEPPQKTRWWFS